MAVGSFRLPSGGASLIVDFSVDDATPDTNQTVTFTDLTVGATQWLWDFGDGTTSTLQNPTKTYKYAGTYSVTLCATDGSISGKEIKTNLIVCSLQPLPSANLQMYNEAMEGATPSNATLVSGAISQWDDNINGYNRTQGTPANRPTYLYPAITAPDGKIYGVARYDGSNDFLINNDAGFTRSAGSFEIFLVKRLRGIFGNVQVIVCSGSATSYTTTGRNNTYNLGVSVTTNRDINCLAKDIWTLIYVYYNEATSFVRINNNNEDVVSATIGAAGATGSTQGGTNTGTFPFQGDIAEHIVYTAKPSDADLISIKQRFTSKFGILWE